MALGRQLANLAIACICALAGAALSLTPPARQLGDLDIDILHALRHATSGGRPDGGASRIAVVAIDEATYRAAPFAGLPKVMWTPQIAEVQDAVLAGGAKVFGWDLILPTSAAAYVADPKFDVPLLKSLSAARKDGGVVLGTASFADGAIRPHALYTWAAGGATNLRSLNVTPDAGGVLRRVPVFQETLKADGERAYRPSMALELAARVLGLKPERTPGGGLRLGGKPVPAVADDRLTLNFASASGRVPAYSFADLYACAERGDTAFFRNNFEGKAVLLGLVLDIEDRKLASNRFYTHGGPPGPQPRCASDVHPPTGENPGVAARATTPGVYLQAVAVNNLLHGDGLRGFTRVKRAAMAGGLAFLAGAATIWLPLGFAAGLVLLAGTLWTVLAAGLFGEARLLPLLAPLLATLIAFIAILALRFVWLDRQGRFLRRAFSSYVSPALVEQLVANPDRLKLSGERREMSFLFTDLAGFTAMVERIEPEEAVSLLNDYLDHMIEIARNNGGTIDKVIGDAVVVLFSAPLSQVDHAGLAIGCALEMDAFASRFAEELQARGTPFGATRIGVHSGSAIIGNFGGSGFFDYTALGDAMNTASRLEGANKQFGTRMAVSGETVRRCGSFHGRKIGKVVLKGKSLPVAVYEPVTETAAMSPEYERYEDAYALLAEGKSAARKAFAALARDCPHDALVRFHLTRLKAGKSGETIELTEK